MASGLLDGWRTQFLFFPECVETIEEEKHNEDLETNIFSDSDGDRNYVRHVRSRGRSEKAAQETAGDRAGRQKAEESAPRETEPKKPKPNSNEVVSTGE